MGKHERLARLVKFMSLLKANRQSLMEATPGGYRASRRENRRDIESPGKLDTKTLVR